MTVTPQSNRRSFRLLGTAIGALLIGAHTLLAQAGNCATVRAASLKMEAVPYHMYFVDSAPTDAALHGGKPTVGEAISAGGAMYVLSRGKWVKSPISLAAMKAERDKHDWTKDTCSHLRDESVNGEPASVWRTHVVTEMSAVDTDMWISKSRGLVLKATSIVDVGGAHGKTRTSGRYEYTNVRPPAGVQ